MKANRRGFLGLLGIGAVSAPLAAKAAAESEMMKLTALSNNSIVDEVDYHYLIQWRWRIKKSRVWKGTKNPKMYLSRAGHESLGLEFKDENGKRIRNRVVSTIFLHTVVMERTGIPRPNTKQKIIVDHANGNGLDCRRKNLRWATLSFNNKNIYGSHEFIMQEVLI
jgi:HNH endonuclease